MQAQEVVRRDAPGAVALFSGKTEELSANWVRAGTGAAPTWRVQNGALVAAGADIVTKQGYTDFFLHAEFNVPLMADRKGQARGNSGIKLQGRYEIQILDSYGIADPGTGDCGAVYTQAAPLFNACRPPGEWQSFDIVFRAPRVDAAGAVTEPARVTVIQNGVVVQNNTVIKGPTGARPLDREVGKPGPILLQYHHAPVRFRNVWIVPLPEHGAEHY